MPTLMEFVDKVMIENHIASNAEEIIKLIKDVARQRQVKGVAVISDDEIKEMVVNNAELAGRLAKEKEEKQAEVAARRAEEERQKEEKKIEKALQEERKTAEGEQTALF